MSNKKIELILQVDTAGVMERLKELAEEIENLKKLQQGLAGTSVDMADELADSYEKIMHSVKALEDEQSALTSVINSTAGSFNKLGNAVNTAADGLKDFNDAGNATEDATSGLADNIGKVANSVEQGKEKSGKFVDAMKSLAGGLSKTAGETVPLISTVKGLNAAMSANPIMGIVKLLLMLVDALMKNETVADRFAAANRAITNAVGKLIDIVATVAMPVIERFATAVEGAANLFTAIFAGKPDDAFNSLKQMATGIETVENKAAKATIALNKLKDSEAALKVKHAELNEQIKQQKDIYNDSTKTIEQRGAAMRSALEMQHEKQSALFYMEQQKFELEKQQYDGQKLTHEQTMKFAEQEAKLLEHYNELVRQKGSIDKEVTDYQNKLSDERVRKEEEEANRKREIWKKLKMSRLNDEKAVLETTLFGLEKNSEAYKETLKLINEADKKIVDAGDDSEAIKTLRKTQLDFELKNKLKAITEAEEAQTAKEKKESDLRAKNKKEEEDTKHLLLITFYTTAKKDTQEYNDAMAKLEADFAASSLSSYAEFLKQKQGLTTDAQNVFKQEVANGLKEVVNGIDEGVDKSIMGYDKLTAHNERLIREAKAYFAEMQALNEKNNEDNIKAREENDAVILKMQDEFVNQMKVKQDELAANEAEVNANAAVAVFDKMQQYFDMIKQGMQVVEDIMQIKADENLAKIEELEKRNEEIEKNKSLTEQQRKDLIIKNEQEIQKVRAQTAKQLSVIDAFKKTSAIFQIAIDTGKAIASTVAQAMALPPPGNVIAIATGIATVVANMVKASQIIKGTNQPAAPKFAQGGYVDVGGRPHAHGGTKYFGEDGNAFEVERGERIYVLKTSASNHLRNLSGLNTSFGGNSWANAPVRYAAQGGQIADGGMFLRSISNNADTALQLQSAITEGFTKAPPPILRITELEKVSASRSRSVGVSEL